jgi:hypothetical protein
MVQGKLGKAAGPAGLCVVGVVGPHWAATWATCRGEMGGQTRPAGVKLGFGPLD